MTHHKKRPLATRRLNLLSGVGALSLIAVIPLYYSQIISWYAAIYWVSLSSITFILYALDKQAAKKQRWRIKETTLHMLALFGGWPGALLAQQLFRHKSAKGRFKLILWLTIISNIGLCYLLLSAK